MNLEVGSIASGETIETAFAQLESCLERFLEMAPVAQASQIRELLPEGQLVCRRLILVELIKVDMSVAAESGFVRPIEWYLLDLEDLLPLQETPLDLVLEELQLRREAGQEPDPVDYRQRFPHLATPLRELLVSSAATTTTKRGKLPELAIGDRIDDFKILASLGQGAFARVYLARQESMARLVALKVAVRGGEEPQALAQLDHPNIVRVYDQRQMPSTGLLLLYMQYIPGGTLADVVKRCLATPAAARTGALMLTAIDQALLNAGQPPPESSPQREQIASMDWPTVVTWIGVQLAEGLGYAHRRGVLHRDVKPANILLTSEGLPKLADFNVSDSGISGRAGAAAHFGGSLAYMSPEQLRVADAADDLTPESLDGRSDLYSLAIVLWELWQGERPWASNAGVQSWHHAVSHQQELRRSTPKTPHRYGGAAERVLENALKRMFERPLELRAQTGDELAGRLRLALFPETAARFEPERNSLASWLLRLPVVVIAAIVILIPNAAAGAFNYAYNEQWIAIQYGPLLTRFHRVALVVNWIAFPLGAILLVFFATRVARGLRSAKTDQHVTEADLKHAWELGHQAAFIGGGLWMIAGLVYPLSMRLISEDFKGIDALHFFGSLTLCGGVAWIYPFFGLTLLTVSVYYPKLVATQMNDADFSRRMAWLRRRMNIHLFCAAGIPLLAITLMLMRNDAPKEWLLRAVAVTAVGLVAAFAAFQKLESVLLQLGQVLITKRSERRNQNYDTGSQHGSG